MAMRFHVYLFRQLFITFLVTLGGISLVIVFSQSFRLVSFIVDNAATTIIFGQLLGLMLPTFLPTLVPLSLGVAALFAYNKLASDSELVVMRAVGLGPWRLAAPALVFALLTVGLGYGLTLYLTPAAQRSLIALQYRVRSEASLLLVRPGTFTDLAPGLTIFARTREGEGNLTGILIHDVRRPDRPVTVMAERGSFSAASGVPQIIIAEGRRQEMDLATGHLSELTFDRYVLDLDLADTTTAHRLPDPREQTLSNLLDPPTNPSERRGSLGRIASELHQRLATPWLALDNTLIALIAVIGGAFDRRGMTRRLLAAGLALIALQALVLSLGSLIERTPASVPLLYALIGAPTLIGLVLLRAQTLAGSSLPARGGLGGGNAPRGLFSFRRLLRSHA